MGAIGWTVVNGMLWRLSKDLLASREFLLSFSNFEKRHMQADRASSMNIRKKAPVAMEGAWMSTAWRELSSLVLVWVTGVEDVDPILAVVVVCFHSGVVPV